MTSTGKTAASEDRAARTWNPPDVIADHRRMTPEQRVRKAIEISRAALRFARAPRPKDEVDLAELDALHGTDPG